MALLRIPQTVLIPLQLFKKTVILVLCLCKIGLGLFKVRRCNADLLVKLCLHGSAPLILEQELVNLHALQLILIAEIDSGFFTLLFKRSDAGLNLTDDIGDTGKVLPLRLEILLSRSLSFLNLRDSGSFVENLTAFLGLTRKNLINLALSDDGIAFLADTGIVEELLHIS